MRAPTLFPFGDCCGLAGLENYYKTIRRCENSVFQLKKQRVTKRVGTSKTAVRYLQNGGSVPPKRRLVPRKRRFGTSKTALLAARLLPNFLELHDLHEVGFRVDQGALNVSGCNPICERLLEVLPEFFKRRGSAP
jgi:hypothetical protein